MTREPIITSAGAYSGIDEYDYHRNPDLLPAPSLSSTGAKRIIDWSPFHFWADSPMNPHRPPENDKPHLNIGKAAHDLMLLSDRWPDHYHVLPEGYSAAATKKFADAIVEHDLAMGAGKTILRYQDAETVNRVADAIGLHGYAVKALTSGQSEMTIAWQDAETGVWLRARPDFLPDSVTTRAPVRVVSDLKFMASTHCRPSGFARAIGDFGYHVSAAFYSAGIEAVYGVRPTNWLHIVVEKDYPHSVSLYELPPEDIARGQYQVRKAVRIFADCLAKGTGLENWPSWTSDVEQIGLTLWLRKTIDEYGSREAAGLVAA